MEKARDILFNIGIAATAFFSFVLVFWTVTAFIISSQSYLPILIEQIKSGELVTTYTGTIEEKAAQIQHLFLILGIVILFISILTIARLVMGVITKHKKEKLFYIITLVLSIVSVGPLFIAGSILALLVIKQENEEETINASI